MKFAISADWDSVDPGDTYYACPGTSPGSTPGR